MPKYYKFRRLVKSARGQYTRDFRVFCRSLQSAIDYANSRGLQMV